MGAQNISWFSDLLAADCQKSVAPSRMGGHSAAIGTDNPLEKM